MKKIILSIMLLMTLAACVPGPNLDTYEKRYAALEISWKNLLATVDLNIDRLTPEQAGTLLEQLPIGEAGLKAALAALEVGNIAAFEDNMKATNAALGILRSILTTLETGDLNGNLKRYHTAGSGYGWPQRNVRDRHLYPASRIRGPERNHGRAALIALSKRDEIRFGYG